LTAEELESLLAPVALYPDQLLAQILAAATYPLQIVDARRWMGQNPSLHGDALIKAAAKQEWDPSVQALVFFPAVLERLDDNLKWTTALGNAFLAQQEDVMLMVQRLRQKARKAGVLDSNAQQKVEVQQVAGAQVIAIQPASPDVVYVPSYNPTVIFGPPPAYAPYPPMRYPPPTVGAIAAGGTILYGTGIVLGTALGGWHGGGWGWGCNWGPHPALYVNNTFIHSYGLRALPNARPYGSVAWAHNPAYRGTVPYSSAAVAKRYGAAPAIATPYGSAPGLQTPRAAPLSGAERSSTPEGSALTTPKGTYTNPKPNPFGGGGAQTRLNSQRGAESLGNRGVGTGRRR
jgi:hypothetical protein